MAMAAGLFLFAAPIEVKANNDFYTENEILNAARGFFGETSGGLAAAVEKVEAGEPEFYKRLKQELSEEDFEALLHCKPKMAAQFGLTPTQFKQLKKTARLQGKLDAELRDAAAALDD